MTRRRHDGGSSALLSGCWGWALRACPGRVEKACRYPERDCQSMAHFPHGQALLGLCHFYLQYMEPGELVRAVSSHRSLCGTSRHCDHCYLLSLDSEPQENNDAYHIVTANELIDLISVPILSLAFRQRGDTSLCCEIHHLSIIKSLYPSFDYRLFASTVRDPRLPDQMIYPSLPHAPSALSFNQKRTPQAAFKLALQNRGLNFWLRGFLKCHRINENCNLRNGPQWLPVVKQSKPFNVPICR